MHGIPEPRVQWAAAGAEEPPRAVKILLTDAAYLDELIAYLVTQDCIVEQVGPNLVEVSRLSSVRHDQARFELELFLQAWKASHPEAHVRLLD